MGDGAFHTICIWSIWDVQCTLKMSTVEVCQEVSRGPAEGFERSSVERVQSRSYRIREFELNQLNAASQPISEAGPGAAVANRLSA